MTRALLTSAILLFAVSASAQQDVFIQDDGTGVQQNQQQQQYQAEPQAAQPAVAERGARQSGVYLTVPLFLTDPTDVVTGRSWEPGFGIGIGGRFGWEFGMLVPEVHIGVQTNLSSAVFPPIDGGAISRITSFHFSIGARLQFLNPSRFLPFVAVAFRGNFWGFVTEEGGGSIEYDFNPAASGTVGLAVELSQTVGLEAAVDVVANFGIAAATESVLDGTDILLIPRLGGTLYF
ncbi:MAG: hypothetical protein AB8H86_02915 [Polyangiales bacterium]